MISPTQTNNFSLLSEPYPPEGKGPKSSPCSPKDSTAAACLASPGAFYFWERKAATQLGKASPLFCLKTALGSIPILITPLAAQRYFEACPENNGVFQTLGSSAAVATFSVPFIDIFNRYTGGQKGWQLIKRSPIPVYACIFFSELGFLGSVGLHPWIERTIHEGYGDHPLALSVAKAANGALLTLLFHPFDTAALRYAYGMSVNWRNPRQLACGLRWNMLAVAAFNGQVGLFEHLLKKRPQS